MLPVYTVSIRRSKRAKRMSLHVRPGGFVELVLPQRASERAGAAFVRSRHDWITKALLHQEKHEAVQKPVLIENGAYVPCFGDSIQISIECISGRSRSTVTMQGSSLIIRVERLDQVEAALETWYKRESLAYFTGQSQEYADALGVSVGTIRTIQMKTQWGSCNKKTKALTFNWKLALGPEEVARYVVAHEVAHLLQSNHSRAFWNVVKKIDPDYAKHRAWLKAYGGGLYLKKRNPTPPRTITS